MSDTQKHKKLNVPNLRFPGFSGEWRQYTMGEITQLFSRRNKNKVDYQMFSVTNTRGFVNQQEQFEDREMKGEDIAAYKIVSPGEFAYNPARINVGSVARYNGETDCMISSLYVCFKAKIDIIDPKLLLHILKSPKMIYNYGINGEGGVRIYLFYPNFARIRVNLPSLKEQRKIAALLDLIEERIQIQNKIIEEYRSLKNALENSLFSSQQNNKVSLGSIARIEMGQSPKSSSYNYNGEGLPLIQGNLDLSQGNTAPSVWTKHITKTCDVGDIILTVRAPVGEVAHATQIACIGRGVCRIKTLSDKLNDNVYQFLSYYRKEWIHFEQGSTFSAINRKDIESVSIPIIKDNQISVLKLVDTRIRCSERVLSLYREQKRFLIDSLLL